MLCGGRELLEGAILCSLDLVLNKDPLHCGVEREGRVYGMEFISLGSQAFVRSRMALDEKPMVIPNNNAMMTATRGNSTPGELSQEYLLSNENLICGTLPYCATSKGVVLLVDGLLEENVA